MRTGKNDNARPIYVVIDDDPTGCQTVHHIDVLLTCEEEVIGRSVRKGDHFFILTNSRSMSPEQAYNVNKKIAGSLKRQDDRVRIISRSDSTLRGYFKEEIDGICAVFGVFDAVIVAPAFFEGARVTLGGTHYIRQNDTLIPVDETEFASDPDFGFSTAYLPDWISEKTKGAVKAKDVLSISVRDVKDTDQGPALPKLFQAPKGAYAVLDVENYSELETIIAALSALEATGKKYLYRSAASLVKTRLGIDDRPFYAPSRKEGSGIIVVGSYVQKTTQQLDYLLANAPEIKSIEIRIDGVLDRFSEYQSEISKSTNRMLEEGRSVVVYTERNHREQPEKESRLSIHARVAEFLSTLVSNLRPAPGFIVAKGGITSHDVAARGLNVTKATVLGQLMAGVPVWKLYDGLFPAMEYVVFPGNVGTQTSLLDAYKKLSGYVEK